MARSCEVCGTKFEGRTRTQKYCSEGCQQIRWRAKWRDRNPTDPIKLNTNTVGALHELIVCADLLQKGFAVFRAVSPSAPCDLAVLRGSQLLRIEVRTGQNTAGGVLWPKSSRDQCDHYAVVLRDRDNIRKIHYSPPLPEVLDV